MLVVLVLTIGIGCAVLTRLWSPARERLSVAATTILAVLGAAVPGLVVMELVGGSWRPWLTIAAAGVGSVALVHVGAVVNHRVVDALRRRQREGPGLADRVETWAAKHPLGRSNAPVVAVRAVRRSGDVRVTGLAAEMTYYGLISLVPLLTALGASLGFLERVVGSEQVTRIEDALVDGVATVFAEQVAEDLLAPLIEGLLSEERTGIALGSVAVALWLASRMFRAAIRALDDAYRVPERRSLVGQYVLGIALALGAVVTLVALLAMVVVGPLLGDGPEIAARFGLGSVFEVVWGVVRWPAVAAVSVGYLTILYRYGPNVRTTWQRCVPGAVVGTVGLVVVAAGFSRYLALAGPDAPGGDAVQGAAVTAAAQTIGLVLAGVVWLWLSSIVILAGGVLNAEVARERDGQQPARVGG